jgi:hypothetical protein
MVVLKRRRLIPQRRIVMVGWGVSRRGKWISQRRAAMIGHGIFEEKELDFPAMTEMELRYGLQEPTSAGLG